MAEAQTSAATPAAPPTAPATPPATPPAATAPATPPAAPPDARTNAEALAAIQKARKAEKDLDAARKAIAEKDKILSERDPEKLKERLRTAPWDALMAAFPGMSKADITKALLGAGKKPDPQAETARKLEALERQLAEERETRVATSNAQRANAVLSHCMTVAKEGGEAFELVAFEMQAEPEKWKQALIEYEKRFPKHDARQALEDMEAALLQRAAKRASLRKVRALYAPDTSDPKAKDKKATGRAEVPRTLTQSQASERATPASGSDSPLRSRERAAEEAREAAIAAFVAAQKGSSA